MVRSYKSIKPLLHSLTSRSSARALQEERERLHGMIDEYVKTHNVEINAMGKNMNLQDVRKSLHDLHYEHQNNSFWRKLGCCKRRNVVIPIPSESPNEY